MPPRNWKAKLSNNDLARIRFALQVAQGSTHRTRMAAVIESGGRILSYATNSPRNSIATTPKPHCSYHAEIAALKLCRPKIKRATIYVARLSRLDIPALARPCGDCWELLVDAGMRRVVWSVDWESYGSATF